MSEHWETHGFKLELYIISLSGSRILQSIRHENVLPILSFNADHYPSYFTMSLAKEAVSLLIIEVTGRSA